MAIKKLNIVMSYPVEWTIYNVMNNFVQNFYDGVGSDKFMDHFSCTFENSTITLKSDVGFSKEWLYFMGTSTKRDGNKTYAGKFGEGFKVASLVAHRDFGLGIYMESRDWRLTVVEADDVIDGREVKVLAYDVEDKPFAEASTLMLTNATEEHYREIRKEIDHFYYEGNDKFGKEIAKGENYAVYRAKRHPGERFFGGSLFVNYQWRDSLDLPIVVCNHDYTITDDDRDRISISLYDSNSAVREVFRQINPGEALELLEICRPHWKNTYGKDHKGRNWYSMLKILISKVANDEQARKRFLSKYAQKIVTTGFYFFEPAYKRKMAMEWFRQSEYHDKVRVVCDLFDRLGLPDIHSLCEQHNGFDEETVPDEIQQKYIDILKETAETSFSDLICYEEIPECRILLNKEAPLLGKVHVNKTHEKKTNRYGMVVVTDTSKIYLQRHLFAPDRFSEALVVYLHELLHQFGGDCSSQFKAALLQMNRIILENTEGLGMTEQKWRTVENVTD